MTTLINWMTFTWATITNNPWNIIIATLFLGTLMLFIIRLYRQKPFSENKGLESLTELAVILAPFWFFLLCAVLYGLAAMVLTLDPSEKGTELRWHILALIGLITALGGVLGSPIALIRLFSTERQTATAEEQYRISNEGHFTDRINKAVEQLGKDKVIENDRGKLTVPNIEVRIGALIALERISQDSVRDHISIMEILCAYIRENTTFPRVNEDGEYLAPRQDIQTALTIIGRRSKARRDYEMEASTSKSAFFLDLSNCNLQHSILFGAKLNGARFVNTNFTGAFMAFVQLERAELSNCDLSSTILQAASLESAVITNTTLDSNTDLEAASFKGAILQNMLLDIPQISQHHIENIYSDGTISLPDGLKLNHIHDPKSENANIMAAWLDWREKKGYNNTQN